MTNILEYAPRIPWYRSEKFRRKMRRTILLLTIAAIIYPAIKYGPPAVNRLALLREQERAMNCVFPAGATTAISIAGSPNVAPEFHPLYNAFPNLHDNIAPYAGFDGSRRSGDTTTPLFLHRVSSPAGERLVYIYFDFFDNTFDGGRGYLFADIISPATFAENPRLLNKTRSLLNRLVPPDSVCDPRFCPHFTGDVFAEITEITVHQCDTFTTDTITITFRRGPGSRLQTAVYRLNDKGDNFEQTFLSPEI